MIRRSSQSGFTAVELLITLFVAAAFLIAGYQLFNVVIKDGGQARAESRAANVAYDYLRRYSSSATDPCTPLTPLTNSSISIDGLSNAKISIVITCPSSSTPKLSEVEATITFNSPQQTVRYSTFTTGALTPGSSDITSGLVGWWRLNGNGNAEVGSNQLILSGGIPTLGQNGQPNNGYSFNGTSGQYGTINSTFGLGTTDFSISLWVNSATASNSGAFVKIGGPAGGVGVGMGTTYFDNTSGAGTKIIVLYEGIRWITTTTDLGTGWHHVAVAIDSSGVPTIYRDGASIGTFTGAGPIAPTTSATFVASGSPPGGTARFFNGSLDDLRIYNRALTAGEVSTLYGNGGR